jgi:hypothetical protein
MNLNRKQLPNFGRLKDFKVDNAALLQAMQATGLLDFNLYNDIDATQNGRYSNFTVANSFNKRNFFTSDASLKGEEYRQLYLTDPEDSIKDMIATEHSTTMLSRQKRLFSSKSNYDPVADELNYGKRNDRCNDAINELLDKFSAYDKVTRVRLAWLRNNFSIKPHIDYDPSYIVRYHIPLITNEKCLFKITTKNQEFTTHFKDNGDVYFLNTGHIHWATNESDQDRLHLIVDVHGQNLLSEQMEEVK